MHYFRPDLTPVMAATPRLPGGAFDHRALPKLATEMRHRSVTYVLGVPGFLKVGVSKHLRRRVETIQTANPQPVTLLGFLSGDIEERTFSALDVGGARRALGEWFGDDDVARQVLGALGLLTSRCG